jgi:hypothetical protein
MACLPVVATTLAKNNALFHRKCPHTLHRALFMHHERQLRDVGYQGYAAAIGSTAPHFRWFLRLTSDYS